MGPNVGYATLSLIPSMRGLESRVRAGIVQPLTSAGREGGEAASKGILSTVGSAASKVGGLLVAGFAVEKVTSFFAGAVGGATDLAESISKNTVVFGAQSEGVLRFAEGAASALGQTNAQALEATGIFGNLMRAVGLSEEQSATMSTSLVKLGSDLASFNNVDPTEALDALRSGLVGETEPLKRFGVNLNEAALSAKAMELGLHSGKGTLDANAKAQAAYALIMEQTSLAQGDFARTSDGLANQQRILSARFGDIQAKVGQALLPVLTELATFATNTLLPGLERVGGWLGSTLGPIFSDLGGGISTFVSTFRDGTDDITSSGLAGFLEGLAIHARNLWDVFVSFDWAAVFDGARSVAEPVLSAIATTSGLLIEHFDKLVPLLVAGGAGFAGLKVAQGVETAFNGIVSAGRGVTSTFGAVSQVASTQGVSSFQAFTGVVKSSIKETKLFTAAQALFNAVMNANPIVLVVTALAALTAGVIYAYQNFEWFRNIVDGAWDAIQTAASWAWENVLKPIFDHWQIALTLITGPIGALAWAVTSHWDKIAGVASWAWENVLRPVFQGIWTWIQNNLIPASQVLWGVLQAVWSGIASAISWAWENVISPIWSLVQWYVTEQLIPGLTQLWEWSTVVWEAIAGTVSWAWSVISPVFESIKEGFGILAGWFGERVEDIKAVFSSIADALSGPFTAAFNLIATAWNNTVGKLSFSTPDIPGTDWGGITIEAPQLPTFHSGGRVPGRPGEEVLALLEAGETVRTADQEAALAARNGGHYQRLHPADLAELAKAVTNRPVYLGEDLVSSSVASGQRHSAPV